MIKFTDDKNQIISLWQKVFGDEREYIEFFLNNCKNKKCLGYFCNEKLVSMLFLIDCEFCERKGKYVYAVCTDENHRKKGYSGQLINEAKKYMDDFLCLVPSSKNLFNFYERFGFNSKLYADEFKEIDKNINSYKIEKEYFELRNKYINYPFIKFLDEDYIYNENIFIGGNFYKNGNTLFATRYEKIIEIINKEDSLDNHSKITGMIYSDIDFPNGYINFYLD